jgi:transcriptional regulator with XRE-family HTH domain
MTTSERIFALMRQKNITAAGLSRETGIPTSNISDWKKGKSNPSSEAVAKIANFLSVSTDYLLCRTDIPSPPHAFALSADTDYDDLPPEAKRELEDFREYIIQKYKK